MIEFLLFYIINDLYSSRFVENEQEKLKKTIEQIETVRKQIKQLKLDIQTSLSQKAKNN